VDHFPDFGDHHFLAAHWSRLCTTCADEETIIKQEDLERIHAFEFIISMIRFFFRILWVIEMRHS